MIGDMVTICAIIVYMNEIIKKNYWFMRVLFFRQIIQQQNGVVRNTSENMNNVTMCSRKHLLSMSFFLACSRLLSFIIIDWHIFFFLSFCLLYYFVSELVQCVKYAIIYPIRNINIIINNNHDNRGNSFILLFNTFFFLRSLSQSKCGIFSLWMCVMRNLYMFVCMYVFLHQYHIMPHLFAFMFLRSKNK